MYMNFTRTIVELSSSQSIFLIPIQLIQKFPD